MSTRWSLGVLVGVPVAAVLALLCLAAIGYGLWMRRSRRLLISNDGKVMAWSGAAGLAIVVGVTAGAFWPWDARFHQWTPVTGTVEQTSTRLISSGSGDSRSVEQRVVVRLGGRPYGCDDTRCALLQAGDRVALTCKPEYQWAGVAGEACEFIGSTRTGDMP